MAEQISARVMHTKGGAPTNENKSLEERIIVKNAQGIALTPEEQAYWDARQKQASEQAQSDKAVNDIGNAQKDKARVEAEDRRRRAAQPGIGSTVLTSPLGLPPEPQSTKKKTLLGG